MNNPNKPLMLVLSSPSGAGKTTLSKKIQQSDSSFEISVSHTTRKPRPNEVDGLDYHFVSKEKFESLLKTNAFYEYAQIFGNYYGTSKSSINKITGNKHNVLFESENKNGYIEGFSENYVRFRAIWDPKLVGTIKQMKFSKIDPEGFAI